MRRKWYFFSIVGLLLIGFGLSLLGEAIIYKIDQDFSWFYWGTAALVVFNTGICLVAEAILLRSKMTSKL
jgi:hypothetical protein